MNSAIGIVIASENVPHGDCASAFTTITTVGYGDRYPVTGEGRLVAVLLMLAGIALLGVVTAAVAWYACLAGVSASTFGRVVLPNPPLYKL